MTALVALVLVAAIAAVAVTALASVLRSQQRSHARERDLLTNQLLHLAGKTWTPPPADDWKPADPDEPLVNVGDWTVSPEQEPYR